MQCPIIFIPGLMGSIGAEMFGYKGGWDFGVARWIYNPFIRNLEKLGYRLNHNLFICYYDWRKDCRESVEQHLKPLIVNIEKQFPNTKIDLICHSMGGIVARTYIQGRTYSNNIRNLIILGTPNKGNIESYYLWSTGSIIAKPNENKSFTQIIKKGYIWLMAKMLKISLGKEDIKILHENFKGLRDLIPTEDYGDILCYMDENNKCHGISIKHNVYNNYLLNNLNNKIDILFHRVKNIYCFVGTNNETHKTLILDQKRLLENKKESIIGTLKTEEGDGTVILKSGIIDNSNIFKIEASHTGILEQSICKIASIYNIDGLDLKKNYDNILEGVLSLIFTKYDYINLKHKNQIIGEFQYGKLLTNYEFVFKEFTENFVWVMFKNIPKGNYILEANIEDKINHNLYILGSKVEKEFNNKNVIKQDDDVIEFSFEV